MKFGVYVENLRPWTTGDRFSNQAVTLASLQVTALKAPRPCRRIRWDKEDDHERANDDATGNRRWFRAPP